MCGINGVFDYRRSGAAIPDELIAAMNDAIAHRGPDDHGIWSDPGRGIHLGHRRLSILDLSARGHQPMVGSDGCVVVFNGEIYNFEELRETLRDGPCRSGTDTEVLLRLYAQDGRSCLEPLNGMFAFGLWDPAREQLFLARDRIGIKPLYYTTMNGIFAFSSEIKALVTLPWVKKELDEEALYHFLTFNYLSPPRTMFRQILKLDPGHSLVVGRNGIEHSGPYWEVNYQQQMATEPAELCRQVLTGLRCSVRYQMVSDVPVGVYLSGGVDSSAVVALMSELSMEPVRTFSIGFADMPGYDERAHARSIAKRFRTDHQEKVVSKEEIVDFLPTIADVYDEPLADATSIPIYFLSHIARQTGTKVILTGDGSDELFCGYRNWLRYHRLFAVYRVAAAAPQAVRRLLASLGNHLDENSPLYEILQRAVKRQEFFWGGAGGLKESAKHRVLSAAFRQRMQQFDMHAHVTNYRTYFGRVAPPARRGNFVDWMVFVGLKDIVPNFYLHRADRMGMAHAVELRVPFLDHHFVETAVSLPAELKLRSGEPKYVLKKALEPVLPKEILYRPKQGFCVPLEEWMQQAIVAHLQRRVDGFCRDTGLFDRSGVRNLIDRAEAGQRNVVHSLWNIYFLMAWFDRWLR